MLGEAGGRRRRPESTKDSPVAVEGTATLPMIVALLARISCAWRTRREAELGACSSWRGVACGGSATANWWWWRSVVKEKRRGRRTSGTRGKRS